MNLFQNSGISRSYRKRLQKLTLGQREFGAQLNIFLNDRYGASHFLKPVLDKSPDAFFTNGDDENLQQAWAKEKGFRAKKLEDILLAQIEEQQSEVFYNMDPVRYSGNFAKRLPSSVRRKIAWRAAPGKINLDGYDLVVCNFPAIRCAYEEQGIRTAEFFPAHDPVLDEYAANIDRDIDVLFIGGYSRHHQRRARFLETVAQLSPRYQVAFHLDASRLTKLVESPLGVFPPLVRHRRPAVVRSVSHPSVFGRQMYAQLARAKIVINMAIDMAGPDRGNMRCFEATGAGAMLLSDAGNYPAGFENEKSLLTYNHINDAKMIIESALQSGAWASVASHGHEMVKKIYNKETQFQQFLRLV